MIKRNLIAVIIAICFSSVEVQPGQPQATGTLRGVVLRYDTNEPIAGVRISIGSGNTNAQLLLSNAQAALNKNDNNSDSVARLLEMTANSVAGIDTGRDFTSFSDKDGRFSFEAIPAGEYPVSAERDRFVGVNTTSDFIIKAPSISQVRTNVIPAKTTEIVLKMIPAAVLSGRIVDSNGNTLPNAIVEVLLRTDKDGIPSTEQISQRLSNDRGEYRVFQLPPGEYLLSATPSSQLLESGAPTFYPGTADRSSASILKLRPGENMEGINIQIRDAPSANSPLATQPQN
jgi:hypothetical protein